MGWEINTGARKGRSVCYFSDRQVCSGRGERSLLVGSQIRDCSEQLHNEHCSTRSFIPQVADTLLQLEPSRSIFDRLHSHVAQIYVQNVANLHNTETDCSKLTFQNASDLACMNVRSTSNFRATKRFSRSRGCKLLGEGFNFLLIWFHANLHDIIPRIFARYVGCKRTKFGSIGRTRGPMARSVTYIGAAFSLRVRYSPLVSTRTKLAKHGRQLCGSG